MNPAESLQPDETHAVLSGALRELEGVDARLEGWAADDTFTPFGKRRVVRNSTIGMKTPVESPPSSVSWGRPTAPLVSVSRFRASSPTMRLGASCC